MRTGQTSDALIILWARYPWLFVLLLSIGLAVFFGYVIYSLIVDARKGAKTKHAPFQSLSTKKEPGTLHLLNKSTNPAPLIGVTLRGFESAEEVYEYVYKKFGEAAFEKIVIHRGATEAIFTRAEARTDDENIATLHALMFD